MNATSAGRKLRKFRDSHDWGVMTGAVILGGNGHFGESQTLVLRGKHIRIGEDGSFEASLASMSKMLGRYYAVRL